MSGIVLIGDSLFNNVDLTIDPEIIKICKNAELVAINLEGPITSAKPRAGRSYGISSSEDSIRFLKELNVKIAIIANNHIMDCGEDGLIDTINILKQNDILIVGAGLDLDEKYQEIIIENEKRKVVVLAYTHHEGPMFESKNIGPFSLPQRNQLEKTLKKYIDDGYFTILSYHGGEEYFSVPWPRRRSFFLRLNKLGVNIIYGTHAHAIQPIEIIDNKLVNYSTGNFYFDVLTQKKKKGTNEGYFIEHDNRSVKQHFYKTNWDNSTLVYNSVKTYDLTKNHVFENTIYLKQWIDECKELLTYSLKRTKDISFDNVLTKYLRRIRKSFNQLKAIKRGPKRSRDIDILMCSLPLIRKPYAKWVLKSGYKKFDF
ncbi:MAG: CapA family protein [Bacteroidetes bacterium]|jgi:poly-gamma-glutamate capsule biosynthesis protein CapA/YwtB (metallophosphatase superfamily)|nr:CapA family protein [Bacteroidota bacterium]MBT5990180.1 CapA family protein [Bacteroidota bacterium]MBT7995274.1 CapA family protein [Bacteroidota bacterium]